MTTDALRCWARGGAAAVLILALIIGLIFPSTEFVPQFFRSYLTAYVLWLGITLGCLALTMLHHLVGGGWGMLTRRICEAAISRLPIMALLFLPILFGRHQLSHGPMPTRSRPTPFCRTKRST